MVLVSCESIVRTPSTVTSDATRPGQHLRSDCGRDDYVTERLWATAEDGTKVPISLVYRKASLRRDGSDPLLLDAYGAYGPLTSAVHTYALIKFSMPLLLFEPGGARALEHAALVNKAAQRIKSLWSESCWHQMVVTDAGCELTKGSLPRPRLSL